MRFHIGHDVFQKNIPILVQYDRNPIGKHCAFIGRGTIIDGQGFVQILPDFVLVALVVDPGFEL